MTLVNDVNFMPTRHFSPRPQPALEPRHVVTPARTFFTGPTSGSECSTSTTWKPARSACAARPASTTPSLRPAGARARSISRFLPIPGLSEHAVGFKSLADAIYLRNHVIETLELANATEDHALRDEMLTYVFVGGGYSGLEALAELQDFAADAMQHYPRARLHGMRWVLVEAQDRVLPEVDAELADYALRELRSRGIDIKLSTMLSEVTATSATLSTGETLPTRTWF
jgi:NADH dehydrogenase